MDRVPPAARRRIFLFTLIAAIPALAIGPLAIAHATASSEGPIITFTATGTPPLVCGTRPNVTSMQVMIGTKIIIANQTGVPARAVVGGWTVAVLEPGTGVLVGLATGQHEVRLLPECTVTTETLAAAVTVLSALLTRSASASPNSASPNSASGTPSAPDAPDAGSVTSAVDPPPTTLAAEQEPAQVNALSAEAAPESVTSTDTATATPSGSAVAVAATHCVDGAAGGPMGDGSQESAVIDVRAITLGDRTDPKAGRLLAVIAAICVFGVTAAIIRAIVSQRTSSAVPL